MSDPDNTLLIQRISQDVSSLIEEQKSRGSSGSGDGGGMEARIAKLEADMGNVKDNVSDIKIDIRHLLSKGFTMFLITWGGIIALGIGLAGLMAKGFGWI